MKPLIAGGRTFTNYSMLCNVVNQFKLNVSAIIEGGAQGADRLGRRYAEENNIPYITMHADWNKYGKRAGYIRNVEMAKALNPGTDLVLCFWDGKSKGTAHMIQTASQYGLYTNLQFY